MKKTLNILYIIFGACVMCLLIACGVLTISNSKLKTQLSEQTTTIETLKKKDKTMANKISELEEENNNQSDKISELEEKNNSLKERIDQIEALISSGS